MNTVNEIAISIAADIASLKSSMRQAETTVAGSMRAIEEKIGAVNNTLGLFGAGLSAAATVAFIKNAIDAADAMDELSQKIGVSVEDLAGLQLAFKFGSLEGEALQQAMTKLASAAADGNDGFKALGITATNTDGSLKSTREMLAEVADKFQGLDDGAQKTALAVDIFGKSGANLIPLLNGGSESLAEFDAMAKQMGLTISTETAAKAAEFNDTVDLLFQGVSGLGMKLASDLLPTLQSLAEKFLLAFSQGDRLHGLSGALAGSMKVIASAVMIVVDAFRFAVNTVGGFVDMVSAVIYGDYKKAQEIASKTTQQNMSIIGESVKSVTALFEQSGGQTVKALNQVSDGQGTVVKNVKAAEEAAKAAAAQEKQRQKIITDVTESLQHENATLELTLKLGRSLTDAEKERIKVMQRLGGVMTEEIDQLLTKNKTLEESVRKQDELRKAIEKANEAQQKALEATQAETQKILERNKQLQSEIDQIGLKTDTLAAYEAQVYDTIAAEARAAAETASIDDPALFAEKMRQAEAAESTAMLIRTKYAKLASQQLRDENQKVFDQFTDGMLDAFGRVRLEGESLAESLGRAFESEFEKLILRPVIKAAFDGQDITSAIGRGFDTYNKVFNQGVSNPLGGLGVSAASSFAMSGVGQSLGLSESAVYSALDGATGDLTAAGLQFTQAAAVIGKAAPYFSAVSNALSGNYGASIGAGIGAYFGGPAGAFIGEMIGDKLLGGLFGGDKISARDLSADQLKPISDAVTLGFTDFIKMFEGTGTANFMVSGNTGRQGENPNFTLSTDGYSSRERFAGDGLFARGEIALNEQNVAEEVSRAMFAALQRSDFADNIDQVFDSLDPLTASFAELNFALEGARVLDAVNDSFGKLSGNLAALSGASLETLQAFSNAVGGFENLGNSVAQFNQQFLSEDERLRLEIDLLSSTVKKLGVEVPQTREEFRKLVEAQDFTQQSGIRAYGSLLQMSGAVDQVFDQLEARAEQAAEESRRASEKAAEDARRIADEQTAQAQAIANQRIGLENQILQLMGDTATLRERELAALDPANRYLQAHIYALQDAARAQQERNQALEIERQALERVVNLGKSIADYVRGLSITDPTLSPQKRLQNTSAEFNRLLALAQGGDENALQQITGASDQFLNAAREFYGATGPFQGILENVKDALLDLPAVQTYEQQTISLLKDLVAKFAAFNDVVTIDLAVMAESEITKAIQFVSDTDLLPPDLRQLALADTLPTLKRTIAAILGDDTETQTVKRLALDTLNASVKTINGAFGNDAETVAVRTFTLGQLASTQKTITAILANDATTQEAKRLALEGLGVGQRYIEAIIASTTAPSLKSLILDDTGSVARAFAIAATIDRTKTAPSLVDAVLNESKAYAIRLDASLADGFISPDERLLLETQKGVVDRTVNALAQGGVLTEDQRAIIRAVSGTVGQTVEASVAFANSLSPDGGILAYSRSEVAAAYFSNGKYLSHWLADIAAYTSWSAGHLEVIRNLAANGAVVVRSENRSGSAVGFFADGGLVTGPGGPRSDSIAAYLSNREYVMPNSAVEQFGVGFMDNIKKGMMPVMPVPYMSTNGMSMGEVVAAVKGLQTQFKDLGQQISKQPVNMNVSVVTPDGRVLVEKTITQIQDRARRGDFKIDTRALGV